MSMNVPTRNERRAAVAEGVFAPLAKRELLTGLGETVSKRVPLTSITANVNQPRLESTKRRPSSPSSSGASGSTV